MEKTLHNIIKKYSEVVTSLVIALFFSLVVILILNGHKAEILENEKEIIEVQQNQAKNRAITEDEHEELLDKLDACLIQHARDDK